MLGIGTFIRRYQDPLHAQRELMEHYAARQKERHAVDRRYAHMRFVLRWAPAFRRHILKNKKTIPEAA